MQIWYKWPLTCHAAGVGVRLEVELSLEAERVEAVEEEVPGEDAGVREGRRQQQQLVQDHRAVLDHRVELELEARADRLQPERADGRHRLAPSAAGQRAFALSSTMIFVNYFYY